MLHIKDFIKKMSSMDSKRNTTVVLTIEQARGLRDDISMLLADLYKQEKEQSMKEETITVQVKGGSF